MSNHTKQEVLNRISDMKNARIAAQNAAVAKGYNSTYFDNNTKKLSDIADALLHYFPGYKDAWTDTNIMVASNHESDYIVHNKAGNIHFNGVDNTASTSPTDITYATAQQTVHLTFPTSRNLTGAPACFRLQITLPNGVRKYVWTMDPA